MSVKTIFNPIALVIAAFETLYPAIECEVSFGDVPGKSSHTYYPAGGSPQVNINSGQTIADAAMSLAHELARVAVGHDEPIHGHVFQTAYRGVRLEYTRLFAEKFS